MFDQKARKIANVSGFQPSYEYDEIQFISCLDQNFTKRQLLKAVVFCANSDKRVVYETMECLLTPRVQKNLEGMTWDTLMLRIMKLDYANMMHKWLCDEKKNDMLLSWLLLMVESEYKDKHDMLKVLIDLAKGDGSVFYN